MLGTNEVVKQQNFAKLKWKQTSEESSAEFQSKHKQTFPPQNTNKNTVCEMSII